MTSCASPPGDTGCYRFKRIATSEGQRAALKADQPLWETLVNQLVAHNRAYDAGCK